VTVGPPTERLLRVEGPHFVAGAVWVPHGGSWACIEASPILRWMKGQTPAQAKAYLERKGWSYSWVSLPG